MRWFGEGEGARDEVVWGGEGGWDEVVWEVEDGMQWFGGEEGGWDEVVSGRGRRMG